MQKLIDRRGFICGGPVFVAFLAGEPRLLHSQAMDAAARRIQNYYVSLFSTIQQAGGLNVAQRARQISESVLSVFDIGTMTRLAVGPEWSRFSRDQQAALREAFGRFMVADFASQLKVNAGESFTVDPISEARGGDRIVKTRIGSSTINYLVRAGRVIDIYANGTISELAARRAEFAPILASGGPSGLMAHLRQRTRQLTGA